MKSLRFAFLALPLATAWLLAGCAASRPSPMEFLKLHKDSPLLPYLHCGCGADLRIMQISSPPKPRMPWEAQDSDGNKRVLIAPENYHLWYLHDDAPFVSLNVTSLLPADYPLGRKNLVSILARIPDSGKLKILRVRRNLNGFDIDGMENRALDTSFIVGSYLVFADSAHVIVQVFFMKPAASHPAFHDMESYRARRDDFLDKLTACMRKRDTTMPDSL